jgi:hypothetical protein
VTLGRRPLFFLAVGVVSLLLFIPTPSDFRWVNIVMASIALFWFVLLGIEESQGRRLSTDETSPPAAAPFEREERS